MDATALRWVLAIIGIIIIAGVYLYTVYQHKLRRRTAMKTFTHEELESGFIEDETLSRELSSINTMLNDEDLKQDIKSININPVVESEQPFKKIEKIEIQLPSVVQNINDEHRVAHVLKNTDERVLTGNELIGAFTQLGIEINRDNFGVFADPELATLRLADMTDSGSFEKINQDEFYSYGFVCFFDRSECEAALSCYEHMLKKIDELVRLLDLKVYDEDMQLLTLQHVTQIRSRLQEETQ